jgi:hypothetical protein
MTAGVEGHRGVDATIYQRVGQPCVNPRQRHRLNLGLSNAVADPLTVMVIKIGDPISSRLQNRINPVANSDFADRGPDVGRR